MTPQQARQCQVWIMDPQVDSLGNAQFPWDWNAWHIDNRLVPVSSTRAMRSAGGAVFRLLRRNVLQNGATEFTDQSSLFRVGCYVCIATGTATTGTADAPIELPDINSIEWFGVCTGTSFETADTYDYIGTVTASEVGSAILDNLRVQGWQQTDGTGYPTQLDSVPPANLRSGSAALLVGNAILGTDDSGHPAYLFSRELADLGSDPIADGSKYWTPWRLATHMAQFCGPDGLPPFWMSVEGTVTDPNAYTFPGGGAGLIGWIDSPVKATNWDLTGLTYTGILDLLFSAGTGTGWRLDLAESGGIYYWKITIVSRSAHASNFGPPKDKNRCLSYIADESKAVEVSYTEDDESVYDEVIVQGAPLLFGASVSNLDGNLDQAWNAAQEADYSAATGTERAQTKFDAVFSSFVLKRATPGSGITRSTAGGQATGSVPLTPLVTWDGAVATIQPTNKDQYLPSLSLSPVVPFFEGLGWDGTKTANVTIDKTPKYISPQVYYYDSAAPAIKWKDLLTRVSTSTVTPFSESPQVDVPPNRPGITVKYSRPHTLGLGTFVATDDGGQAPVFDWRKLVCTIGIFSDQRLEVSRARPYSGASVTQPRRQMIIRDDSFRFHCMLAGTVVGLSADNTGSKNVVQDTIIVNDYPAAQAYCDELSEWAFRKTLSARIVNTNEESMSVYLPGDSLRQVVERGVGREVNGLIASIETDWANQRITIQTELPPQPSRTQVSPSPSRGGPVSSELGGSVAQVVQRNQIAQGKVAADVAARPLIPLMGGGGAAPPALYLVIGGKPLPDWGADGGKRKTSALTAADLPAGTGGSPGDTVIVPPTPIPPGLPDGICVAALISTGESAWILCDSTSYVASDLIQGDRVVVTQALVVFDKVSGGVTYRYNVLRAYGRF
jgi:hypothetical protein